MKYSNVISNLEESATLALAQKVRELKAEQKPVIGLTLGEPDFDTPIHIRQAAARAMENGHTHYPPVPGIPELRHAITAKFERENQLRFQPSQIVVSNGAKQTLYNLVMSLTNPGDEAILPAPYWVSYYAMLHLGKVKTQVVPTTFEQNYKILPHQLEEYINEKTKLFFLTTPSNPTGSMYTKEELEALADVLRKYPQVCIISDEIYEHIVFDQEHVSIASFPFLKDRTIVVNGFSKGYAMTGWRLGYMAAPEPIAKLCTKFQGQCTSGANTFAQWGAVAALNGEMNETYKMRESFRQRRDVVFELLKDIPGIRIQKPNGAFYLYPDLSEYLGKTVKDEGRTIENINQLCSFLLEEVHLALVPGSAFGTKQHVRISYAYNREILEEGMERLSKGLEMLT